MTEMTGSTMNARNGEMPPPTTLKRKTLSERAGEPHRKPPAPAMNKSTNATGSYRQPSFASSVASSRPSSVSSSRNISGGSFTSTMSSASRPQSSQSYRSQSAMATTRIQKPQPAHARALSLVEAQGAAPSLGRGQGNRNGKVPFPSTPVEHPETLESCEATSSYDTQAISDWASSGSPVKSQRNISLSTAMDGLSIKESRLGATPIVARNRDTSIATAMGNMSLEPEELEASFPSLKPTTPSHIPRLKPDAVINTPALSPSRSPTKKPSVPKFLTRDTNTPYQGWNYEDKLAGFEKVISEFTGRFEGASTENAGMRELLNEYKARGLS